MRRAARIRTMGGMFVPLESTLRIAAHLALAMEGIFLATGVGQDPLQFVHSPAEYAALPLKGPAALRACPPPSA
jgi:hypothetical protein